MHTGHLADFAAAFSAVPLGDVFLTDRTELVAHRRLATRRSAVELELCAAQRSACAVCALQPCVGSDKFKVFAENKSPANLTFSNFGLGCGLG